MTAKEKLHILKVKKEELLKELQITAKAVFKEESKELFQKHPALQQFSWTQYTPYFNDGEPCVFRSSHDSPRITISGGELDEEEMDEGGKEYYFDRSEKLTAEEKTASAVHKFLRQFDDDDMEQMFGDHMKVTVTAKGVDTDDYDHD